MAVYVLSDPHGCLREFHAMLEKIQFSPGDTLYIDGDVVDKGPEPIQLLLDIMHHDNIHLIMGNHDELLRQSIPDLILEKRISGWLENHMNDRERDWITDGNGLVTVQQFISLDLDTSKRIMEYFKHVPCWKMLEVNSRKFLLVHAGVGRHPRPGITIKDVPMIDLLSTKIGMDDNPFEDITMIVGHTPTVKYDRKYAARIIHGKNLLHIDCGCVHGFALGCVRLDDMQEFYVPAGI